MHEVLFAPAKRNHYFSRTKNPCGQDTPLLSGNKQTAENKLWEKIRGIK
jgi:hypothetical protein